MQSIYLLGRCLTWPDSLGSLAFRYEKACISHRSLQANNGTPARCISVHLISGADRTHSAMCPLLQQVKSKLLVASRPSASQTTPWLHLLQGHAISRRNGGCWGSTVTWKILKSWFHLFRQFINLFFICIFFQILQTRSMHFCYFVLN